MFRSGGGDTGKGNEKECVVEDIRNRSSQGTARDAGFNLSLSSIGKPGLLISPARHAGRPVATGKLNFSRRDLLNMN